MRSRGLDEGPQSPQYRRYQLAGDTTAVIAVSVLDIKSSHPLPAQGPGAAAKNWPLLISATDNPPLVFSQDLDQQQQGFHQVRLLSQFLVELRNYLDTMRG